MVSYALIGTVTAKPPAAVLLLTEMRTSALGIFSSYRVPLSAFVRVPLLGYPKSLDGGSVSTSLDAPFAALAAAHCPAYDEMLVALEREFRAVHHEAVAGRLDELARPLFELSQAPADERVVAVARAAWAALPQEGDAPPHWLLACALEERRGSAPVRAALAVELGRRAGVGARPARMRGCWAVHIDGGSTGVAADVGADPGLDTANPAGGGLCAHQLAFAILSGLASAWRAEGDSPRAQRAAGLRLLLPLDGDLRSLVHNEVRALGGQA